MLLREKQMPLLVENGGMSCATTRNAEELRVAMTAAILRNPRNNEPSASGAKEATFFAAPGTSQTPSERHEGQSRPPSTLQSAARRYPRRPEMLSDQYPSGGRGPSLSKPPSTGGKLLQEPRPDLPGWMNENRITPAPYTAQMAQYQDEPSQPTLPIPSAASPERVRSQT